MPITKGHKISALAAALVAAVALPSAASAATFDTGNCPVPTLYQPFTAIGDSNSYFLAPGGDFEQAGVWSTSGDAETVADARTADWGGSTALRLNTATATSPTFCADGTYPHLRLAAKAGRSAIALTVEAVSDGGIPVPLATLTPSGFRSWDYSEFVPLAPAVGLSLNQFTHTKLRVRTIGDWTVDAVSIDPRMGG
ncbi:MAG: hypothetical protein QOJ98_63 [Acidobacteriota bacterium]|jgi:hypothetical protein|nr:hypothetical protein [Acidobacteriota bacterium]